MFSCIVGNVGISLWIKVSLCSITAYTFLSLEEVAIVPNCYGTAPRQPHFFNKQYRSKDISRVCSTLQSDFTYSEHMKSWKWKRQPPQHRSKHSRELKHIIFSHSSPPIKVLNIFPCCLFVCLFQMSSLHLFVSGCLHFPPVIRCRAALFPLVTMEMRSTCKYLSTLAKAAR